MKKMEFILEYNPKQGCLHVELIGKRYPRKQNYNGWFTICKKISDKDQHEFAMYMNEMYFDKNIKPSLFEVYNEFKIFENSKKANKMQNIKSDLQTEFINLEEFCQMTGWSKNTAYKYLPTLDLKTYRFGRFIRFKRQDVIDFINKNTFSR